MRAFIADTHTIIWFFSGSKRLSHRARNIFRQAQKGRNQIIVPTIVLVESIFLMQRARVDQKVIDILLGLNENANDSIYVYPLNKGVIQALTYFGPVDIPELADRIIAATAVHLDLPLITADSAIQASSLVKTIW